MKIYIAGKITGDDNYQEKFDEVAEKLKDHVILNPATLPSGMAPGDYMKICFPMIDIADAVVFLPDYKESKGALLEFSYCKYCNKEIIYLDQIVKGKTPLLFNLEKGTSNLLETVRNKLFESSFCKYCNK